MSLESINAVDIEKLKNKKNKLAERIKKAKVALKEAQMQRAAVVGRYYLEKTAAEELAKVMDGYLTKNGERALFNLPPLKKEDKK